MAAEYLIKRTDGEWFDLHHDRFNEVLRPSTVPSEVVQGWGDHRIKVEGCELSFSYENAGIQVFFEGEGLPEELERRIVAEIASRIAGATGQKAAVVEL
jgi:hypothetical protein